MSSARRKERRKQRYERNVAKEKAHKEEAWEQGKLILENHNRQEFSIEFSQALVNRLYEYLNQEFTNSLDQVDFVRRFRKYKDKIVEAMMLYNPTAPRDKEYYFLRDIMSCYWDEVLGKENLEALSKFVRDYDK